MKNLLIPRRRDCIHAGNLLALTISVMVSSAVCAQTGLRSKPRSDIARAISPAPSFQPRPPGSGEPRPVGSGDLRRYEEEARNVSIVRDKWGIPHIYGKTDADAVFGLLYAECETDFSRVEKNYLEMLGQQAEAYGEAYLYTDVMMRLIYDSAAAVADYQRSPAWMHRLLDAFADGINYYLYTHPATRPLVLQHFEPWYALMFTDGSVSATSTGGIRQEEIKNFYGKEHPVAVRSPQRLAGADGLAQIDGAQRENRPHELSVPGMSVPEIDELPETGSNGFAIAASRSASGSPMLYINPHVPFYFRMETQIVSEEGLNAYGAVTWGQFFIYQGFNAHCGWMHTSSSADVADLYEEKMAAKDGAWAYEYEGQLKSVKSRPYIIRYKKDDATGSFPFTGYFTHHGPVMGDRNGKWLSLRENNRSLDALLEAWLITKANTFGEYKKAMDLRGNTTNNTVYADD
ncbi:MAG TPA: penicillin acylase family protein, partial [Puia sp.]|nr:penicillin acylase family protein [Puia sp.]